VGYRSDGRHKTDPQVSPFAAKGALSDWGAVEVDLRARMSPTISAWTEATWSSSVRGVVGLLYRCADPATIADLMTIASSPGAYVAQVRARRSPSKPRW
jgi:hypothetical protein